MITRILVAGAIVNALAFLLVTPASATNECSPSSEVVAKGRAIAQSRCAACHGMEGRGNKRGAVAESITPDLAGQLLDFLTLALAGYRKGHQWQEDPDSIFLTEGMRVHDEMGVVASQLDDASMKAVALWYHCQR